jgi:hypothetical protein
MIEQLVQQADVRKCFSWRWLSYALHPIPLSANAAVFPPDQAAICSLNEAHTAFEASGGNIRTLYSYCHCRHARVHGVRPVVKEI